MIPAIIVTALAFLFGGVTGVVVLWAGPAIGLGGALLVDDAVPAQVAADKPSRKVISLGEPDPAAKFFSLIRNLRNATGSSGKAILLSAFCSTRA